MKIVAKTGLGLGISPLYNKDYLDSYSTGSILTEDGKAILTEDGKPIIIE